MKNLFLLLTALFIFSAAAYSQNGRVVLCEDYNKTDGTPTGINKNWDIDSAKGSYVYIIYLQDNIIKDNLMLYVDRKNNNGEYVADDTKDIDIKTNSEKKKWALVDYLFSKSGDYKISVIGKDEKVLATAYTNIGYMKNKNSTTTDGDGITDTYYYENSNIYFGEGATTDGKIKGENTTFRLINGKKEITCLLTNDKALKTKLVYVDLYGGSSYNDKISEKSFTINSLDWDWVNIPITLTKAGKYVVDIYNDQDILIKSGYFEIKN